MQMQLFRYVPTLRPSEWPKLTRSFMSGKRSFRTTGLPSALPCQVHLPWVHSSTEQAGRCGSMSWRVEQLHCCQPSSMLTQSKPSSAREVGLPLTVRDLSTAARICARTRASVTMLALSRQG